MNMPFPGRAIAATMLAVLTTACAPAHYVTALNPGYDPATSARVRILTGNDQQQAALRPGSCYTADWQTDPNRIDVDDGFLSRYKYSSRSVTIGMPPSPRPWMRVEGLHFKDMIREYVVDAGKPLTLTMSAAGGDSYRHWSCRAAASVLTPVAGQDYDIYLAMEEQGRNSYYCSIAVHHIEAQGLDESVQTGFAPKCPPDPNQAPPSTGP